MAADLMPFDYEGQTVRTVQIDGEPWFVAADVARVLEYSATAAMTRRLDDEDKGVRPLHTLGGEQEMVVISEAGFYAAVIGSQCAKAKDVKRWLTHTVLPQIRKTGSFNAVPELTEDQIVARALQITTRKVEQLETKVAELEPSAKAWGHMVDATGTYSVADAAKVVANSGASIGRQRLFDQMAEWGWIHRAGLRDREGWRAYQSQIECGRLVEKANRPFLNAKTGEYENAAPTIRITAKGVDEIYRRLTGGKALLVAVRA